MRQNNARRRAIESLLGHLLNRASSAVGNLARRVAAIVVGIAIAGDIRRVEWNRSFHQTPRRPVATSMP